MGKSYRIGTRTSALAIKQVEEILGKLKKFYPTLKTEIIGIDTFGDKNKDIPISEIEGTDFFTRELDEALLRGNGERGRTIDFAVHSAKDLADNLQEDLSIAAVTASIDPYDALVSKLHLKLKELPYGAKIGTSSLRRKMQLKKYRSDFDIIDIRGTIEERLEILDRSDLHAIVIAAAGLVRLGLENRITQRIPFEILKPHPLQGALAVVTRKDYLQLIDLLSVLDLRETVLI